MRLGENESQVRALWQAPTALFDTTRACHPSSGSFSSVITSLRSTGSRDYDEKSGFGTLGQECDVQVNPDRVRRNCQARPIELDPEQRALDGNDMPVLRDRQRTHRAIIPGTAISPTSGDSTWTSISKPQQGRLPLPRAGW